jgi:hypothetical protein
MKRFRAGASVDQRPRRPAGTRRGHAQAPCIRHARRRHRGSRGARRATHGHRQGCICIEARRDIEIGRIDDDEKNVSMDIIPAAWHGTIYGAAAGLAAGLVAMYIPSSACRSPARRADGGRRAGRAPGLGADGLGPARRVRRTFAAEIESGQVLVVIDAEPEKFEQIEPRSRRAVRLRLPFESTTALTS